MKLIAVTLKQSSSVNLRGLSGLYQMDTKDLLRIAIVKKLTWRNFVGNKISTLARIKIRLLIGKTG